MMTIGMRNGKVMVTKQTKHGRVVVKMELRDGTERQGKRGTLATERHTFEAYEIFLYYYWYLIAFYCTVQVRVVVLGSGPSASCTQNSFHSIIRALVLLFTMVFVTNTVCADKIVRDTVT